MLPFANEGLAQNNAPRRDKAVGKAFLSPTGLAQQNTPDSIFADS
jgi:hypothetical protein